MDDHLELLFVMTEDLFDATKDNIPVATVLMQFEMGYQGFR